MGSYRFAPVVYEHAAAFTDTTPWEVSRHPDLLYEGHRRAWDYYGHTPITPVIDIYNIEAEAYGARIPDPGNMTVPAASDYLCREAADLAGLKPFDPASDGRCAMIADTALRLQNDCGPVNVPVSGVFSLAAQLIGIDNLLMTVLTEPEILKTALNALAVGQRRLIEYYAGRGLRITIFESAATPPMLSPDGFRSLVFPFLAMLCEAAAEKQRTRPSLILGGDTAPIAENLASLNPSFLICPAETDVGAFLEVMERYPDITVRINLPLNLVLTASVEEILQAGREAGKYCTKEQPVLIGSGVLPYDADRAKIRELQTRFTELKDN